MANSYTDANGVYRNKLGITDAAELRRTEYEHAAQRSSEILEENVLGHASSYSLERLQAIHRHLFQDVYDWAGKTRTVPSSKRLDSSTVSVFANPDTFAQKGQELQHKTSAFVAAQSLTFEQKHQALAEIFIQANHIHPFPEGNGRSLQVFMKEVAREQGVNLDYTKTEAQHWNRASAVSGTHGPLFEHQYLIAKPPNPEPIRKIFADMASPMRELLQTQERSQGLPAAQQGKQTLSAYARGKQAASAPPAAAQSAQTAKNQPQESRGRGR